jgi:hypothetical protein
MDLGLGNLADVKGYVLPALIAQDTQYDSVLTTIARGVAGRFESYCNRKFARVVGDQATFDAVRRFYILPRYPFETITLLEMNSAVGDEWTDTTASIVQQDPTIGWIYFGCYLGDTFCLVRCTYTGGYFYETLEPFESDGQTPTPGFPTAVPAGSNFLPAALKDAWLKQVIHEFELKDRLLPEGVAANGGKSKANWRLDQMQLLPEVANAIAQFRRFI